MRITTKESLKQDVEFIELTEHGKKESEWTSILFKQCDRDTATWLIEKEKIRTWPEIKNLANNLKDLSDINKLTKIICTRRRYDEDIGEYVKSIREKLISFDLSDESLITIIANNIWPGDFQTITHLMNAKNIENLLNMIEEERKIKRQKLLCSNCKRNGHLSTNCRTTTPKQNL